MGSQDCPSCGSSEIVDGIRIGMNAEAGAIGLKYQTMLFITGTEPIVADLCSACGTVVRLRVQNTERKWWLAGP